MAGVSEDPDDIMSLQEVLDEDKELVDTANAVLGDGDDSQCSYSKGYVNRQALYACATCVGEGEEPAGMCLACSLHCHDGHQLYELYTKRDFRCDCGNSRFRSQVCTLKPDKDLVNSANKYNHNFHGRYCTCDRPYPDTEDEIGDEMVQCIMCEDWFHTRHLHGEAPDSYEEMVCGSCMESHDFLRYYQLCTAPVKVKENGAGSSSPIEVATDSVNGNCSGDTNCDNQNSKNKARARKTTVCELERRERVVATQSLSSEHKRPGYFDDKWRSQLCRCLSCKEMYKSHQCLFLLDESDTLQAYEARAPPLISDHDATMMAALDSMDRVQQMEVVHQFNELKSELTDFLKSFARKRKVVSRKDIEEFFEEMQRNKRRRMETGDGVPPPNCHF